MLKRLLIGIMLLTSVTVYAQTPEAFPPNGFYVALADINARIGQNISLVCGNQSDAASCNMSDLGLDWAWELGSYPSPALDCPNPNVVYNPQPTSAYTYTFTWKEVVYSYRQYAFGGEAPFLCTSTGREALLPPGSNPAVTSSGGTTVIAVPTPAAPVTTTNTDCPLPPRLTLNSEARVTPGEANNLRAQAGLQQAFVGQIPGGETFRVMGGPVCVDGIMWWQVQYQLSIGWTGEGKDGVYWVEPLNATTAVATSLLLFPNRPLIDSLNAPKLLRSTTLNGAAPLAWSGDGLLGMAAVPQGLWIYDVGAAVPDPKYLNISGVILDIAFSPALDPNVALVAVLVTDANAASPTVTVQVWDAFLGIERYRFSPSASAHRLAFSPDGKLIALAAGSPTTPEIINEVQLWDAQTGQQLGSLAHEAFPAGLAFSPDGKTLATGNGSAVLLWDITTRQRTATLSAQMSQLAGELAFSPDGKLLAVTSATAPDLSGNSQFYVALWDTSTQTQLRTLPADALISGMDFSPDGKLLTITQTGIQAPSGRESVKVFEVATGNALALLFPLEPGLLSDGHFSDDGTLVLFANQAFGGGSRRVEVFGVAQ